MTGLSALYKYILFLFLIPCLLFAQPHPDKKVHELLLKATENIVSHNYEKAGDQFRLLDKEFPKLPLGKIYLAGLEMVKAHDYGLPIESDNIEDLLEDGIDLAEDLFDGEGSLYNSYYLALAHGYHAYYQALTGDYFNSITSAYKSVSYFDDCISIDSTFYEAYVAVGSYKYWLSVKTEFIQWLPFVEDNSGEGIRLLEKSVEKAVYNRYMAASSLVWAYIYADRLDEAEELSKKMIREYPQNRYFKMTLANVYNRKNQKDKAIDIYENVLKSYKLEDCDCNVKIVEVMHKMAQDLVDLGLYKKAEEITGQILAYELNDDERERADKRLQRVKRLREEFHVGGGEK